MCEKKLTKQLILEALGNSIDSTAFSEIMEIMNQEGRENVAVDVGIDRVDYTWDHYGVNIVIGYEDELFKTIFLYVIPDNETSSCKIICKDGDFDVNFSIEDIKNKYGEAYYEDKDGDFGHELRYKFDKYKLNFSFIDKGKYISLIMIGRSE